MIGECSGLKALRIAIQRSVLDWFMCMQKIFLGGGVNQMISCILIVRNSSLWFLSKMFGCVRPRFGPVLRSSLTVSSRLNKTKFIIIFPSAHAALFFFFFWAKYVLIFSQRIL